jgi:RNA 2',3'-cyclic 3'-phosphodiesterase
MPMNTRMNTPTDQQRVFFALWPEDPLRARLAALARRMDANGRAVPTEHLHLTLAFPGSVASDVVAAMMIRADTIAVPKIHFRLDQLGYFRRPRVAWLGPSDPPPELAALAGLLQEICRDCGVAMDDRPFRPHVTLRRFVTRFHPVPVEPIEWSANGMVLIESGRGGRPGPYRVLREWPLTREQSESDRVLAEHAPPEPDQRESGQEDEPGPGQRA